MRTSKEHFRQFMAAAKVWEERLGLTDWRLHYYHRDMGDGDDAPMATCNSDASGRVATITLNVCWPDHYEATREALSKTAFHELCHVLLAELVWMARERVTTDNMLTQAQHAVIRRLERLLVE